ncbi:nodulation protein NopC [Bradyrhizobium sp. BRP22]|nr:nodulation protein NopC [Bradyrhizobium sp. BRP22]MBO4227538.1 nodulation protein NopC [Bradyrhizobium neotropicale]MCA1455138.1 nodulation protein NopC [Bradyrhizobium sp. BRP22]
MRIANSSAAGHVDSDLHAARGDKKGSRAPEAHDDHGGSPGASSPVNGASVPSGNSEDAAVRRAFEIALGSVAFQLANIAMSRFDDAMAETEDS